MAYNKVGFHIAANCGGCTGIIEMWQRLNDAAIPFVVYSANDDSKIIKASAYRHATLIYRDVEASTLDPGHVSMPPQDVAIDYWNDLKAKLPPEIDNLKSRVWLELLNEPSKEEEEARRIGWIMYHMARLALAEGYRVMGPGWSPGTPEPEAWLSDGWQAYLRLCEQNPQRVAVSLHEYSLSDNIHHWAGYLIGRFQFLLDACDILNIGHPPIYITECGWTLNSMPEDEVAKRDIEFLAGLYAEQPDIRSAHLWTLQSGKGNGDLPQRLNALIPWLTDYTLTTTFPDPAPPPDIPPPPNEEPAVNILHNPSFENGWSDADEFSGQHPDSWETVWNTGANPIVPSQPYQVGEAVHKSQNELPPHEWQQFILDGKWTYKAFGNGPKPIWVRLKQSLSDVPAGKYELITPVVVDCYRGRAENKDYTLESNHAQMMVKVNDQVIRDWTNLPAGTTQHVKTVIDHAGGAINLAVHFRANWGTSNNFWVDDWSLQKVAVTPPSNPPPPEPEPTTRNEHLWNAGMAQAPLNFDAALQKKALADGYKPLGPEKWTTFQDVQYAVQAAIDWDTGLRRVYYAVVPKWNEVFFIDDPDAGIEFKMWPVRQSPYVTQAFGARPDVYSQYGFPGHEGIDLRATLNTPIQAVADGTIITRKEEGNYGKHVRIQHPGGWYTIYAHLNAFAGQGTGDTVNAGEVIGYAGTTGNSDGVHLHFGLSHENRTYTDGKGNRWPKGIHDPTPYLSTWLNAPPVEPPATVKTDLLPYLKGDGRIYQMTVMWEGEEHSQQMQTQVGLDRFYLVKNHEWEEFFSDSEYIYRGVDTSPGNNLYYWQRQDMLSNKARWCPRYWRTGETYERNPLVIFYQKDTGMKVESPAPGYRRTWLKFMAVHAKWKAAKGLEFVDVVELHWLPNLTGAPAEVYYYARNIGLVGWRSSSGDFSYVTEMFSAGERNPMSREEIVVK